MSAGRTHRAWALWLLVPLMAFGSAVGVYMARHHEVEKYGGPAYAGETLVGCAEAEGVSCDIVNTSAWSEILHVPTFAWAVPTYLLVAVLAVLAARGRHGLKPVLLAVGLACVGLSGWLAWVSVVELKYVCLWCLRLYAVNAAIPVLTLLSGVSRDDRPSGRDLGLAAAVFAVLAGVTVGGQKAFRASLLQGAPEVPELAEADDASPTDDPAGDPPAIAYDITTEDGQPATVRVHAGDPWKGNPDAKVAILEFADFECGYCKRASSELARVYEAYKDEVVFVYKHFPMDPYCNPGVQNRKHPNACNAHVVAACAQEQGKFWAMHDLLYKNQHDLKQDALLGYAKRLGLDMGKLGKCLQDGKAKDRVAGVAQEGAEAGIHGTPRIWIAGKLYRSGASAEQMAAAIEEALGHPGGSVRVTTAAEAPRPTSVPADVPEMRRVQAGKLDFWIDTFEASLADGKATSGRHQIPGVRMSWYAAQDACEASGKRLCTEAEWIAACQGVEPVDDDGDGDFADDMIEGLAYPYGDFHEPERCWDGHVAEAPAADAPATAWRPVYTGELPACVGQVGVYDLTGNVEEWVGATPEEAVLLGGSFDTPDDKARCYRRNDTYGPGYANLRTGFRCCRTP